MLIRQRHVTGIALLGTLAAAFAASAQTVPSLELGKRTGRTPFSFGFISNVAELPDGRVAVSDQKERAFRLVNFATGDMPVLGEPGDEPNAYRFAGPIFHTAGDSLLLYAPSGTPLPSKFLHVSPEGTIVGNSVAPSPRTGVDPPRKGIMGSGAPLAIDSAGATYYLVTLADSLLDDYELGDIVQMSADGKQRRVVDYPRQRRPDQLHPPRAATSTRLVVTIIPFPFRDAWALRPDGLAARVVADTYQVIWSRDGHEVGRTEPLPYEPILITAAEQQAFRDSIIDLWNPKPTSQGGASSSSSSSASHGSVMSSGTAPTTGDNTPRTFAPPSNTTTLHIPPVGPFPDRKPAIPDPQRLRVAFFDPAGRLWILRERAHGDDIPHVDIVVEGKGLAARINLPKNTRIVGFGPHSVYLASHDSNGDWLERYPLPVI